MTDKENMLRALSVEFAKQANKAKELEKLEDAAEQLGVVYKSLQENGFSKDQAFQLIMSMVSTGCNNA